MVQELAPTRPLRLLWTRELHRQSWGLKKMQDLMDCQQFLIHFKTIANKLMVCNSTWAQHLTTAASLNYKTSQHNQDFIKPTKSFLLRVELRPEMHMLLFFLKSRHPSQDGKTQTLETSRIFLLKLAQRTRILVFTLYKLLFPTCFHQPFKPFL